MNNSYLKSEKEVGEHKGNFYDATHLLNTRGGQRIMYAITFLRDFFSLKLPEMWTQCIWKCPVDISFTQHNPQ